MKKRIKYIKLKMVLECSDGTKRGRYMFARLPFQTDEAVWFGLLAREVRKWLGDHNYFFKHYKNYWSNRGLDKSV